MDLASDELDAADPADEIEILEEDDGDDSSTEPAAPALPAAPRVRPRPETHGGHDAEYDLLTAALIGATIGAGLTFMLRRGPSGRRPVTPIMVGMSARRWMGGHDTPLRLGTRRRPMGRRSRRGRCGSAFRATRFASSSDTAIIGDYMGRAREAIDDAVESELKRAPTRRPSAAEASWDRSPVAAERRGRRRFGWLRARWPVVAVLALVVSARGGARVDAGDARLSRRGGHSFARLLPPAVAALLERVSVRLSVRVHRRRHEHREEVRAGRPALPFVERRVGDLRRRATTTAARVRARLSRRISPPTRSRTTTSCRRQLAVTSSTSALGHSYWESRFETHLGTECARRARELILIDHSRSDGLLDRVLSPTIFSTPTNRRIFRGMVIVADNESWQRIFQLMKENSRWDLAGRDVGRYIARSYDFIIDLLRAHGPTPSRSDSTRRATRRCAWRSACDERCCARATSFACTRKPTDTSACRRRALDASRADSRVRSTSRARVRQQLIQALRVGASLRLLHHVADEHSLQPPFSAQEAPRLVGVVGEHLVDPARRVTRRRSP